MDKLTDDWHEPTPEPPKWRRLVDAMPPKPFAERHPLAEILERLAVLDEYSDTGVVDETRLYQMNIARIIAVCEQEVGDGWQADPGGRCGRNENGVCDIWCLLAAFEFPERWRVLGNRAASWLVHLAGEES